MDNPNGLIAPASFWLLSEEEVNRRYNGCGYGKYGSWLTPDSMWGIDIKIA